MQFAQAVLLEAVSSSPAAVEALKATGAQDVFQQASFTLVGAPEAALTLCYAWCKKSAFAPCRTSEPATQQQLSCLGGAVANQKL